MTVALNVSKFKPDELKVNIDGRILTVEGKQKSFLRANGSAQQLSTLSRYSMPSSASDVKCLPIVVYQSPNRPSTLGISLSQRQPTTLETA
ncbi:hypothetical protein COOONC_21795 [Cooperia oncophora]